MLKTLASTKLLEMTIAGPARSKVLRMLELLRYSLRTYTRTHLLLSFGANLTDLQKYINFVSAINFGFILQCSWEAAAVTFQFSLANGGPAAMFYGSLFAGIGTTTVA